MVNKQLNLAICGYGGIGAHHAATIIPETSQHFKVIGSFDIKEIRQTQARQDGIHAYDNYRQMLEDPLVDLVLIATPNHLHKDLSIQALKAGKHVLCEKPVTLTTLEFQDILQVEKETGKTFMVHQNRRWDPDFLLIKNLYKHRQIGEIFHIESRVMGANGIPGDWRSEAQYGGGMLYDWGVHLFDQILQLVESPLVSVYCDQSKVLGKDADDGFISYLKFANGLTALIEVGTTNFIRLPRWYVKGLEGNAVIEDWDLKGRMIKNNLKHEFIAPKPVRAGAGFTKTMAPVSEEAVLELPLPEALLVNQSFYDNLYQVIVNKEKALVQNSQVLKVMELIESMFESVQENKVVYLT